MFVFCNKCGKELAADALFCSKCGNKVQLDATSENTSSMPAAPPSPSSSLSTTCQSCGNEFQSRDGWRKCPMCGGDMFSVSRRKKTESAPPAEPTPSPVSQSDSTESWRCEGCEQKFETESKTVEHEKNCPQYLEFKNLIEKKENTVFKEDEKSIIQPYLESKNLNLNFLLISFIFLYLVFVITRFNVVLGTWVGIFACLLLLGAVWLNLNPQEDENLAMKIIAILKKHLWNPIKRNNGSNMILFYGVLGCFFLLLSPFSSWFVYDMGYQYYDSPNSATPGEYGSGYDRDHEGNHGLTYDFNLNGISVYINTEREWEGDWYETESYWLNSYDYPVYDSSSSYQELNGFEDVQDLTKIVKYLVWSSIILWIFAFVVYHYKMRRFLETEEIREKIELLYNRITNFKLRVKAEEGTNKAILAISAITAKIDKSKTKPYVVIASSKKLLSGLTTLTFISIFLALSTTLYFETSFISTIHDEDELVIKEDSDFSSETYEIRVNGKEYHNGNTTMSYSEYGWVFEWGKGYGIYFIHMSLLSYLGIVYNSIILMKLEKKDEGDIEEIFDSLFVKE